ncbi:divalent-cation tolerance protein CutA [Halochromatium glycolicum]|jgi:periplasmic divalent cation tolerance protein|uniref:Divalent-cation tolerance protein CutA n=1 Tax=Halochromatium glycolicum TaxID=85075 RepID=A0AAJ0XB90_9GAMM|nr:divalent-cation tolerance protein CutA [Halochromatium glycolicum]MBK1705920.1 divalent-cation tolerance protein CutA [Halochromatium glycolicum]
MSNQSDSQQVYVAYCTCPNAETAQSLAEALVSERLAACVNALPGVTSVYRWESQVETDTEVLLIIKTTEPCITPMTARIASLHPYDVPEVISHPITTGHENYLDWVRQCTATNH